jgi:hypothetical protein
MNKYFLLGLLMMSPSAFAGGDLDKQAFQFSEFNGDIAGQVKIARSKIDQIEYKELTSANRQVLLQKLDVLEGTSISKQQSAEAQASANDILAKAFSDSKLTCSFETALGSNMKKRICVTAAAKKRIYEKTQKDMENRPVSDVAKIAN